MRGKTAGKEEEGRGRGPCMKSCCLQLLPHLQVEYEMRFCGDTTSPISFPILLISQGTLPFLALVLQPE